MFSPEELAKSLVDESEIAEAIAYGKLKLTEAENVTVWSYEHKGKLYVAAITLKKKLASND